VSDCFRFVNRCCVDSLGDEISKCDFVVTDPPYGISLKNHNTDSTKTSRRTSTKSYSIAGDGDGSLGQIVVDECHRHGKPLCVFASPWKPFSGEWRNLVVWNKGGAVGGGGDTSRCLKRTWELIQVYRNGPTSRPRGESVVTFKASPHLYRHHPCAKPVDLMVWIIETFTKPGDVILDPFMGSGTTGVACMKTGRRFVGYEIDPSFFAIASERIHNEAQLRS
jgi:DNA modification methylase